MRLKQDPTYTFTIQDTREEMTYENYAEQALEKAKAVFIPVSEDSLEFRIDIVGSQSFTDNYVPEHAVITVVYHVGVDSARDTIKGAKQVYTSIPSQ